MGGDTPGGVQRTYLALTLVSTLASSLIWGVNTLFLLDAGLTNVEAFAANAAYTLGMVIFEIPTGVVADTRGRRYSFLLGTVTLLVSTLLYLAMWYLRAPLPGWVVASVLIGLGFTFFTGATEAWLVDALRATGFTGSLDHVLGRAQVVAGAAMLTGSVLGGLIAQLSTLGAPYLARAALLGVTWFLAWRWMHDRGFTPSPTDGPVAAVRTVLQGATRSGLGNPPVRWLMLSAPFISGAGVYTFYVLQPYLMQLYGDPSAYLIAGLAAAVVAGAQIVGGLLVARVTRLFRRRTDLILAGTALVVALSVMIGTVQNFWLAVAGVASSALVAALVQPVRQGYLNRLIPSGERATVLSFDSLMGSIGGVVFQPLLGWVADLGGYARSYQAAALVQSGALPFQWLARRTRAASDAIEAGGDDEASR